MKQKHIWILSIISILTLVPFRIYQKIVAGESSNVMFGVNKTDFGVLMLFAAFVLTIIIMTHLLKDSSSEIKIQKSKSVGTLAFASGTMILINSIAQFMTTITSWIDNNETLSGLKKISSERVNETTELIKANITVENITMIRCICGIAAFGGFIILGICAFKGKNAFTKCPIVSILPALWASAKVVEIFMARISLISQKNDAFDVLEIIFILLFLFTQSKIFANIEDRNKSKRIFCYGVLAVLSIFLYNIPALLLEISSNQMTFATTSGYIGSIVLSLYIIFFLIGLQRSSSASDAFNDPPLDSTTAMDLQNQSTNAQTVDSSTENSQVNNVVDYQNKEVTDNNESDSISSNESVNNDNVTLDVDMLHVNEMIDKFQKSEGQK